jgi:hypothetical protein
MPNTWYLDYESGNDNWSGDSFAVTVSGANGVTNGTSTFSSAGANFTSALVSRYININTRGFYLVTAAPTSTTLTLSAIPGGQGLPSTGSSLTYFIGGRWSRNTNVNINRPVQGGDTVRFKACESPVLIDNATWTQGTSAITFNSTVAQVVDSCDSGWVAAANVTRTHTAGGKDYTGFVQLDIAAGFTTGIVAYKTLPSTLNLSNYNVLSFWHNTATILAASAFRVDLCSDSVGAVPVASFNIPNTIANGQQTAIPFALSSIPPLPSNVNSISIFAVSDPGAVTLRFDHFVACLSSGPNLQHYLGKYDNNPYDHWWAIRTLSGSVATIENYSKDQSNFGTIGQVVYPFATETVPTYFVNPIRTPGSNQGGDNRFTGGFNWVPSPTYNTPEINPNRRITYSGGWDRNNMSTKVFKTFFDGLDYNGQMMIVGQNGDVEDFIFSRFFTGISVGFGVYVRDCDAYFCSSNGIGTGQSYNRYKNCRLSSASMVISNAFQVSATDIFFDSNFATNNLFYNLSLNSGGSRTFQNLRFNNCGNITNNYCIGEFNSGDTTIKDVTCINSNKFYFTNLLSEPPATTTVYNLTSNVVQILASYSANSFTYGNRGSFNLHGYNGDVNDIRTFGNRWTVLSERVIRNQTQGLAWEITTPTFTQWPLWFPICYKVATVAARANTPVRVTAYIYSSKTQAQGLSAGLMCFDDIAVNIAETRAYVNNTSALTYLPVTWAFTPTVDSVIPVYFFATLPSNADYAIIDSVSVQ